MTKIPNCDDILSNAIFKEHWSKYSLEVTKFWNGLNFQNLS